MKRIIAEEHFQQEDGRAMHMANHLPLCTTERCGPPSLIPFPTSGCDEIEIMRHRPALRRVQVPATARPRLPM